MLLSRTVRLQGTGSGVDGAKAGQVPGVPLRPNGPGKRKSRLWSV